MTKERNKYMENINDIIESLNNAMSLYYYHKDKIQKELVNTDEDYIELGEAEKEYQKALIWAIRCFSEELSSLQE